MTSSQVRVGVRVRPISAKEQGSGETVLEVENRTISLSGRRFTYDHVFDSHTSQQRLYEQVSPSLLQSFLEGYNATIMAYGQTGSGKTFTMGSEAHTEMYQSDSIGLIPRFMNDLFLNLVKKDFTVHTSFLEVYGEECHDLLDPHRKSLPLREDGNNSVICPGLTAKEVNSAEEALAVLHEGTMNRTTAATLMNLTSSRSHAVFTVTLHRNSSVSRFNFVDLAGSERLKKTGCIGERAREGIEINKGLLALGNVINALADEERHQKKLHVPYRQSKLTRLLQDALGGNSQTLFLACVSAAESNASETLSTLHYANRARNIQNAPIRTNLDPATQEMQHLQAYTAILQAELIHHKFGRSSIEKHAPGIINEELMKQQEVNAYLDQLQVQAEKIVGSHEIVFRKPLKAATSPLGSSPHQQLPALGMRDLTLPNEVNQSILENFDPALLDEVNPDEELAILDQLLELQQHDQEFDNEQKMDHEKLKLVEGELAEQEHLLLQLRDSLKVYHNMKAKYESLMAEVQQLEFEKTQLAEQLQKATADPTQGCSRAIQKEMEMVERNLARAKSETQRHRQMYKKAEQEAQRCRDLEHKITDLKAGRANLMKKQKVAAARHRELTERKTREITALKRKDRNTERQLTKLQSDIQMHKRNLEKRQVYCRKLTEQKRQAEEHLMKLLAMRQRELRQRTTRAGRRGATKEQLPKKQEGFAPENEAIDSLHFLLDKAIADIVSCSDLRSQYEDRMSEYSEAMRSMVAAVKHLHDGDDPEVEHTIQELELKTELAGAAMEKIQSRLSYFEAQKPVGNNDDYDDDTIKKLIQDKTAPVLRTVLIGIVNKLAHAETQRQRLAKSIDLKESVVKSYETEFDSLNNDINALKRELVQRHSVVSGKVDPIETIEKLKKEKNDLVIRLEEAEQETNIMKLFADDLATESQAISNSLAETKENFTLFQVAVDQRSGVVAPDDVMQKLHSIWNQIGVSLDTREKARVDIENCLGDTCLRILEEAQRMKSLTENEIKTLQEELMSMCTSLDVERVDFTSLEDSALLKQLEKLQYQRSRLVPIYTHALSRRDEILTSASDIVVALGIQKSDLSIELLTLMEEASREKSEVECKGKSNLTQIFLSRCEASLTKLRMRKSKVLTNNSKRQEQAFSLVSDMNICESEVMEMVIQSVKRRNNSLPPWWNHESAEMVNRAVSSKGGVVRSSHIFSQHLNIFCDSLSSVSKGRYELSNKLRSIVERAQNTLLSTVDAEFEANEAYSSFHEALFQLPPLSKDFIYACLSEIEALISGVDAMMQSEVEALTVVWEALCVSASSRGQFWGSIEQSLRQIESEINGPFDNVLLVSSSDGEEWVLNAVKDGTKNYRSLEMRLSKLETIHAEVEQLRSRQDSKSKIISLDSEVRLLSSKLNEFEDKKCVKQRLTTKKNTSSNLLKEERFRKQMQSKFTGKLEMLETLLAEWKTNEKSAFDPSLLSEEVRAHLKNSDRKEFMHLRTVEYKSSAKRGIESQVEEENCCPPSKRRAVLTKLSKSQQVSKNSAIKNKTFTKQSSTSKDDDHNEKESTIKSARCHSKRIMSPVRSDNIFSDDNSKKYNTTTSAASVDKVSQSPLRKPIQTRMSGLCKRPTLDPFCMVLGEAVKAKENQSIDHT